ncbi:CheA-like two-component hybrid sensor and regulator [Hyella patelloides LEGE 07179]|uniref:histidine kinase n=1 Tax=Hyella patelloides LEGE 07179 TaxID=945734 RepID=A0A563VWU6_9CYAN|nr:response regulator [Hyella patelloides]VEP15896.1 CheA-like two-component hybrid sensor and regulator [Hyella patelloides LEGE 07179]
MITDPDIRDQAYQFFLEEAPELLQTIEEEIFAINEGEVAIQDRALRVNSLMRAAHTLKGGAANVGLETIKTVAHSMEDVFKALYNPELEIDDETKRLIYESFECLREPLTAEFSQVSIDRDAILDRAAAVFAQLQEIFGDYLTDQDAFPTSEELGLDVVESFFDAVIPERLQELSVAIAGSDNSNIAQTLRIQAEIFIGLAESLGLPGFGEIAQTIITALDRNSNRSLEIAQAAMANIEAAKKQVLEGDRERGGEPSSQLLQFADSNFVPSEQDAEDSDREILESMGQVLEQLDEEVTSVTSATLIENQDTCENTAVINSEPKNKIEFVSYQEVTAEDEENVEDLFTLSESDLELLESDNSQILATEQVASFEAVEKNDLDLPMATMISDRPIEIKNEPQETTQSEDKSELLSEIWGKETATDSQPNNSNQTSETPIITKTKENQASEITSTVSNSKIDDYKTETTNFTSPAKPKLASNKKSEKERKSQANRTVRVNLESLEKLNDLVGELLINQNQNILKDEQIYTFVQELLNKINYSEQVISQLVDSVDDVYISPEQEKLRQELPQKLSEIVSISSVSSSANAHNKLQLSDSGTNVNQLLQLILNSNSDITAIAEKIKNHNKQAKRNTQKQQRMLLNMRDELIETRMSPIGRVFNRFPRMLQQLSSTYKKPVELKIIGGHILVDKTIEEKLYDPLLHLIRNSFDHGIEPPEARQQQGKSETGTIELRAYYQGGKTIIEIKDDGKGIDIEKIKNRAIERKLITAEQGENLGSSRLLELLFEPGFSTAEKVSSLSGRGVGLDVVRSQIEAMEGNVSIESVPNKGTIFALQIPLSLTIAKLMLTQAGGITYALLIDAIERIVVPISNQIKIFEGHKVLHWQTDNDKEIIPVRRLSSLIEYPRTIPGRIMDAPENLYNPILLLRRQGGLIGLEVDRVLGEQELVIRPLGSAIAPPKYIYGCSVLKDSSLTLVIDGAVLLKLNQYTPYSPPAIKPESTRQLSGSTTPALPPSSDATQAVFNSSALAQTLLVVDDSSSLRQSIAMSLEKVSDEVYQAENGLKALEKLQKLDGVNLIVCDLEMPMMNGFQFLKALRQTKNNKNIPVIILTSRDSDKHRKLALQLGAAAYLIKPCDEQELFDTINRILRSA